MSADDYVTARNEQISMVNSAIALKQSQALGTGLLHKVSRDSRLCFYPFGFAYH